MASTLAFCISNVTTLALGLRPKQGHGKVWVESATQKSLSHSQECEGLSPHTLKWIPILRVWIPMESWIFKKQFEEKKTHCIWTFTYTIENLLNLKCLKWTCMIHLNTYNKSYGQKKGWINFFLLTSWDKFAKSF